MYWSAAQYISKRQPDNQMLVAYILNLTGICLGPLNKEPARRFSASK